MGFLDNVLKFVQGNSSIVGSAVGAVTSGIQNHINRKWNAEQAELNREFQSDEAEKARLFNSREASLQRDWSSQEAERARDWNEEMYAKYNSLSGKIAQAEQAGVNPMFAVTGNAVSPMQASSSAPSGASASGPSASGSAAASSFVDLVGSMLGMSKLKAEIENIKADTRKKSAEGEGQEITNESLRDMNVQQILESRSRIQFNEENTKLVTSKILNTDADTEKKGAELGQIASSIANMDADSKVKEQQIAVMLSEISRNSKSEEVMDAQITELISRSELNDAEKKNAEEMYFHLVQEYDHQSVMNSITEISAGRDAGAGPSSNFYYRSLSEVKRFINSLLGWWSGNTSIDVPHKKPAKIGFK